MAYGIDELLERARRRLTRVGPPELAALQAEGALLVDIRPQAQRADEGSMPGALVIARNVREWRLDPRSPHRIPEAKGSEQTIVILCSEGYASSLAAATLQELGLKNATDLAGGFRAWQAWSSR